MILSIAKYCASLAVNLNLIVILLLEYNDTRFSYGDKREKKYLKNIIEEYEIKFYTIIVISIRHAIF